MVGIRDVPPSPEPVNVGDAHPKTGDQWRDYATAIKSALEARLGKQVSVTCPPGRKIRIAPAPSDKSPDARAELRDAMGRDWLPPYIGRSGTWPEYLGRARHGAEWDGKPELP